MERPEPIVAVGLFRQRDLDLLGSGFQRSFPIDEDSATYSELLDALDKINVSEGSETET